MGPDGDQAAFVGHGVGLDLDELPVVTERGRWRLTEGMVIAIEPKMVFPGQGAVGVENTWLITADGIERLTSGTDEVTCVG